MIVAFSDTAHGCRHRCRPNCQSCDYSLAASSPCCWCEICELLAPSVAVERPGSAWSLIVVAAVAAAAG